MASIFCSLNFNSLKIFNLDFFSLLFMYERFRFDYMFCHLKRFIAIVQHKINTLTHFILVFHGYILIHFVGKAHEDFGSSEELQ